MARLVRAAYPWVDNGALIADLHALDYLRDELTLDPTYGRGLWWTTWRPAQLIVHDRKIDGTDFRHLPYGDAVFPQIAYDPPYVCPGGLKTSTIQAMHTAYGMNATAGPQRDFATPGQLQQIMNDGLTEMVRLLRPGGTIVTKAKDYIWSGRLWIGTHHVQAHALELGLQVIDRLEHVGSPGPQSQKRQVHARRNLSTMFVLRKPGRRPR
jgi:tRNA G10  N-methylase Trm11